MIIKLEFYVNNFGKDQNDWCKKCKGNMLSYTGSRGENGATSLEGNLQLSP